MINLDKVIQKIKLLMKESFFYKKQVLLDLIDIPKIYPLVQKYAALTQLIEDSNEFIIDKYGRTGHLINIGEYYLFQPNELNFKNVDLSNVDLRNLDLSGANFEGADLEGVTFEGVHGLDRANFKGTVFEGKPGYGENYTGMSLYDEVGEKRKAFLKQRRLEKKAALEGTAKGVTKRNRHKRSNKKRKHHSTKRKK
jgi:hypothetical protein